MSKGIVLSLADYTGNMVEPWAEDGYDCRCYDLRHEDHTSKRIGKGYIQYIPCDLRNPLMVHSIMRIATYRIVFAFPPCTNLAVSGARWFQEKGIKGLIQGLELVEACREIAEDSKAPWMLENPVSTLSTYWRKPDHIFHPYEYAGYPGGDGDTYTKKTCLWTGGGFVMPNPKPMPATDDRIHQMPPSADRGYLRSITPRGFANAVFEANANLEVVA